MNFFSGLIVNFEFCRGESFTMYDIAAAAAANKDRVVADLVFEGQLLSVIPTSMKMEKGKATVSSESGKVRSLGLCSRCMKEKTFTVLSSFPHSSHAKTTGYFLLLVPLIAFCIRFVMGALHNRVAEEFKHNVSESDDPHPRCKRTRWRSALQELRDPDANALDTDLSTDHDHSADDEEEIKQDDLSHNYTMLESDYAKFLSECGISNCGYWRGGSPK
ncbi:OLC1v1016001C1 [Oldenlandia corymbosa var. corymbosa]|uniref:OLC1v1016001C1 n=1 Tax=Oldenlandia corymbosa var. corymbosa TaxID=529605 RepID=A0AAV1E4G8_OLDCO|nr:OLC1v1016001C1 [Oldenlandia corymbosa var. corymbosa]